jgi:hypothetical protein
VGSRESNKEKVPDRDKFLAGKKLHLEPPPVATTFKWAANRWKREHFYLKYKPIGQAYCLGILDRRLLQGVGPRELPAFAPGRY